MSHRVETRECLAPARSAFSFRVQYDIKIWKKQLKSSEKRLPNTYRCDFCECSILKCRRFVYNTTQTESEVRTWSAKWRSLGGIRDSLISGRRTRHTSLVLGSRLEDLYCLERVEQSWFKKSYDAEEVSLGIGPSEDKTRRDAINV